MGMGLSKKVSSAIAVSMKRVTKPAVTVRPRKMNRSGVCSSRMLNVVLAKVFVAMIHVNSKRTQPFVVSLMSVFRKSSARAIHILVRLSR